MTDGNGAGVWVIIRTGLIVGAFLNLLGWLGNVFVLGEFWNEALIQIHDSPWRNTIWKEIVSFAPDFIYCIVMVWLYDRLSVTHGATLGAAYRAALAIFVTGVFVTYLGTANAGLLPWKISLLTTVLALVTFIPGAWLMHRLMPRAVATDST